VVIGIVKFMKPIFKRKPNTQLGIGISASIRDSKYLSGNDLGQLGHVETLN
jgi:hypothetical protein